MKEKYKFRGKEINSGRWVYGAYISLPEYTPYPVGNKHVSENHYIIVEQRMDWGLPVEIVPIQVIPETVGQCTGLTDINNNYLYEGDIVKDDHDALHYVYWCYTGWELKHCYDKGYTIGLVDDEITLVGNIHDNPELIKE